MRGLRAFLVVSVVVSFMLMPAVGLAKKQTLVYGTTEKLDDLDPHTTYTINGYEILCSVYPRLLKFCPGTTDLEPDLALSYTSNEDNTEYTFKLREGLAFPDGTPLDATVVKHCVDRVAKLSGPPAFLVTDFVDRVEVVGQHEVKFVLKRPLGYFPNMIPHNVYIIVNPKLYPMDKRVSWPSDLPGGKTAGLGPYNITSFKRDEEIVLEANPDYYGPKPKNERIVIRIFADATTMRLALEKGELDFAFKNLNPVDIDSLEESGKFNVSKTDAPYLRYMCFLTDTPPFDDKALRQAVAYAVDRAPIAKRVFMDQMRPSYDFMAEQWSPYVAGFKEVYGEHGSIEKAKELLASRGYTEENKLIMDLWYTPSTFGDTEVDFAAMLKAQIEATGLVTVNVHSAEWASFIEKFTQAKDMPAYLLAFYPDYVDPDALAMMGSGAGAQTLGTFYSNEAWDAKLAEAASSSEPEKRIAIYQWILRQWAEEVPVLPLLQGTLYVISQKNIEGVTFRPIGVPIYSAMYRVD